MSDMDATIPEDVAYAAALAHNPRTGETTHTTYRSDEGHHDPVQRARALRDSCEDDFPGWIWSLAANERALTISAERRTAALLGEPDPHPDPAAPNARPV